MNLLSRLIRLPLRLVPTGGVVRIPFGQLRGARWDIGSATHGCWIGVYEREVQRAFVSRIRPGMTVYDIGANVGFFSLLASRLAGSGGIVYAFEPQPRNVRLLEFHRAANGITNLRILDAAVSARDGVAQFQSAKGPAMGSLAESGEYAVTTVTVDSFASDHRPPDVMKIDVEGAEVEVLTGATKTLLRHRPVIILSTHGWRLHQESLALLASLGYEHEMLRDGTRDGQYTVIAEGGRQRPGA